MESSQHIISIVKGEENIAQMKKENNKIHPRDKQNETRNIIHSVKVGVSLVLVSLMYLLNPLFHQVGENAMWAIMTVIVIFEFSPGATLGKGLNRGMGTIVGGGLGCLAAFFAHNIIGGVGNSVIIGTVGTYFRLLPKVKQRYEYGVVTLMLTFNLVMMYGVRANEKVWEIARQRLLSIVMGFIVCICVSLFIFPLWASDELHHSTVSTFHDLANTIQGCLEENGILVSENESQLIAGFTLCNSVLNSKSKDELLANSARWEPWHGKFGFCYPWENYLKIGNVLRELATFVLAVGHSLQSSKQDMASLRQTHLEQFETCEAIGSRVAWALRELGDSMKQMKKCEDNKGSSILAKLKECREELSLVISTSKVAILENGQVLAISSLVFLLMKVVDKVEELVKEVEELGQIAAFPTNITIPLSS
ncbi:hypothetical protein TanjilG_06429 [Lupinus angustifolius]|uniref:Aluminum-activated malate transporter n=1 Tax=Lupinus angustifolius TaxID=3871 RepID=A0A1J7HRI7_LUPAN|nr:hypothetical protein TanjilG_06429 [Lupinus angustifolius]